jgi:hypothetical protein
MLLTCGGGIGITACIKGGGAAKNKEFCIVTINESHRICTMRNHLHIAINKFQIF